MSAKDDGHRSVGAMLQQIAETSADVGLSLAAIMERRVEQHEADVDMARRLIRVALGPYGNSVALKALALEMWERVEMEVGEAFGDGLFVSRPGKVYVRPMGGGLMTQVLVKPEPLSGGVPGGGGSGGFPVVPVEHEPSCLRDGNCDCDNPAYLEPKP